MNNSFININTCTLLSLVLVFSTGEVGAENSGLDRLIEKQTSFNRKNAAFDKSINEIADETKNIIDEYKSILVKADNLNVYNRYLEGMVESQKKEEESLNKQLNSIDETSKGIVPLMIKMVDSLEKYISLDIPFLLTERKTRLESLNAVMERADVSTSEKYRRILEAYQIEMEYGRTLETYKDNIEIDNESRAVNYFRLGRVAYMYQSLDGSDSGIWDKETKQWVNIGTEYKREITKAMRIAMKQLPPDFIVLPIRSAENLQ